MDFSTDHRLSVSPAPSEFEISIFGPGIGECVLLHLGSGEWFVVDSCRFPGSTTPVALEYLQALGIEPSKAICRILATHWHDDHIQGLADIVRRCPDAPLIISGALKSEQFFQLVYEIEHRNKLVAASSTATEFADILDQFASIGQVTPAPDMFASDGSMLYQGGYLGCVSVQALSPSAATIVDASANLIETLCTGLPIRKFNAFSPNHLSVAVQVTAGPNELLLKADLENTDQPQFGWKAVLQSPFRPKRRSQVVKVGHHGSSNAHNDQVWDEMISLNPLSVVTPYSRLRHPLPQPSDLVRLKVRTSQLYVTTWPPTSRPKRRRGIDGAISAATRLRRALNRDPGFVRIRFDLAQTVPTANIELFGSACQK